VELMNVFGVEGRVADATDPTAVPALIGEIVKKHSKLDCLINNSGVSSLTPASFFKEEEMEKILNTNLKAVMRSCQAYYKAQKKQGGIVINVASASALVGFPLASIYSASKAAVIQLTRALAIEWVSSGFRLNALCPGFFATDMISHMSDNDNLSGQITSAIPVKRFGKLEELVPATLFLASEANSYMTGQTLLIDGGVTAS